MNATFAAGLVLAVAGLVGYGAGVIAAYPGRSFSLTALMLGLTLAAVGRTSGGEEP